MGNLNTEETILEFSLKRWSAWLPGQSELNSQNWPVGRNLALETTSPDLGFLPHLQRRRLTPLARAAIAVAWDCWRTGEQIPTIFSSTHGETDHCFNILGALAENQDVSPTQFTFSVHSGIAAMFSILTHNKAPYIAMAPGKDYHSHALLEAYTMMVSQGSDVLVVFYDQPVPEVYRPTTASPTTLTALALRLTRSDFGSKHHCLSLTKTSSDEGENDGKSLEKLARKICRGDSIIVDGQYRWNLYAKLSRQL